MPKAKWTFVGAKSMTAPTVANFLDTLYALGQSATWGDNSARTEGVDPAWIWTGRRYQNAGVTESLYPKPAAANDALSVVALFSGCTGSLPSPSPTMDRDTAATDRVMVTLVKNAGAYNAWNNAAPMTTGQGGKYVLAWSTAFGTCTLYLWESRQAVKVKVVTAAGSVYFIFLGGFIDPLSSNAAQAETDGLRYATHVTGTGGVADTASWTVVRTTGTAHSALLGHSNTATRAYFGVYVPGSAALTYANLATIPTYAVTTSGMKTADGKPVYNPLLVCNATGTVSNDWVIGRLREIFIAPDAMGTSSDATGYTVATSDIANGDALYLRSGD